jgi:hypothetical protein
MRYFSVQIWSVLINVTGALGQGRGPGPGQGPGPGPGQGPGPGPRSFSWTDTELELIPSWTDASISVPNLNL